MKLARVCKSSFKYLTNSKYRFLINAGLGMYNKMADAEFLKKKYFACMGKNLDLDSPKTFNEKLQWIKLYDRNPEYTMMVDKYLVREYIKEKLGEEYLIPLLGVWDDPDEIDFDALPDRFVLKCNHNSGLGMYICKDKTKMDVDKVKAELRKGLAQDYYLTGREWPYKNVPRKIIAEQYMEDEKTSELRDYKFFCFNGSAKFFKIDFDRFVSHRANYFDQNGEILNFGEVVCPPDFERELSMPQNFELMKTFAETLSKDIPFVRVDFYEANGKVYFGEITFFPAAGFGPFEPEEWDEILGEWIELPVDKSC